MCGRTCCTLPAELLPLACANATRGSSGGNAKNSAGGKGNNNANNNAGKGNKNNANKDAKNNAAAPLPPTWQDAPNGAKYYPSTNIPPTSYTPVLCR